MSSDSRRKENLNQTKHQEGNMAGTALQNLWDRCHRNTRLSSSNVILQLPYRMMLIRSHRAKWL